MNQGFIAILQQLITEQGKEALLNPAKCKAFLADYTKSEYKKESRLLLQALDAGVPKAIDATKELEICKQQQIGVLQEEYSLTVEAATDLVDTLALVLREKQESEVSQGPVCSNCGKELQKEWEGCPYCLTPVAKKQQSPTQTKPQPTQNPTPVVKTPSPAPAVPSSSPAPVTQTTSTIPIAPPKNKNTSRNVAIAIVLLSAFIGGIIILANSGQTAVSASDLASADKAYGAGVSYYYNAEYDNAINQFNEAIRLNPRDDWAYAYRGQAYWQLGKVTPAIRDLEKALSLNPNNYWARQRLKEKGY